MWGCTQCSAQLGLPGKHDQTPCSPPSLVAQFLHVAPPTAPPPSSLSLLYIDSSNPPFLPLRLFCALPLTPPAILTCRTPPLHPRTHRFFEILFADVASAPLDSQHLPLRQDVDVPPQRPRAVPLFARTIYKETGGVRQRKEMPQDSYSTIRTYA